MKDRILLLKPETWQLIKRMAIRSAVLFVFFSLGLFVVDELINSGFGDKYALVRRFPDLIPMMVAASKLTFVEMSLFWIRLFVSPKHDVQEVQNAALGDPKAAAFVALTNMLTWAIRLGAFLYLMEH